LQRVAGPFDKLRANGRGLRAPASARPRRKNAGGGVCCERRLFHALFATANQKVGLAGFVAKRQDEWRHR